ncbi:MAG: phosphatase PAP2 family protein [Prevotella sp.]|jgi:membrane-associated phospholipid phosphatase|nr:phosphatase PAP2 family protein [Prevotella sp.]
MFKYIKEFFTLEKKPTRGLLSYEWVILAYLTITLVMVLFMFTKLPNANNMVWGRVRILAITLALWGVYRMIPCKAIKAVRAIVQMSLLSWWYPDIFELNRLFPNLDHIFATWEQTLFGCQPALLFSQFCDNWVFSELMCLGYTCYYPLMAVVASYYLLFRYQEFDRCVYIIIGTFFIHYVIFIVLPVTGPQYYYPAVGMDDIAQGIFPNLHDYFNLHQERMACPGYSGGFFYSMVDSAHDAGERPVAAFPSSHVSVCVVLMILAWKSRCHSLFYFLLPFAILLFFSTVYICAHYAIDAIAGIVSGILCFIVLSISGSVGKKTK